MATTKMSSKPKTRGLAEILRLEKERRAREEANSEQTTSALDAIVALDATHAGHATVAANATHAQNESLAPPATVAEKMAQLVPTASVAPRTREASSATDAPNAPVIAGYTSLTNDLLDRILPTLDPYEQVVLIRLYRLTRGFNQDVAKVGHKRLISACNVKKRKLSDAIQMLERRGFIERIGVEQGGADREERGTHYRMLIPGPTSARRATNAPNATSARTATVAPGDPYKRKELKETNKTSLASLDTKNCPDCQGSGFWYPEGMDKGVAKCKHERLVSLAE